MHNSVFALMRRELTEQDQVYCLLLHTSGAATPLSETQTGRETFPRSEHINRKECHTCSHDVIDSDHSAYLL